MTTAPHALGSNAAMATEATHVTGRQVLATIIDGLIFGIAYWLLARACMQMAEGTRSRWRMSGEEARRWRQ